MPYKRYWFYICIFSVLTTLLYGCGTFIKIPVVTSMPRNVQRVMKGKKKVGIVLLPFKGGGLSGLGLNTDWSRTVHGAVQNAVENAGYFTVVDISSRKSRLSELGYQRSGLTEGAKEIGKELAIDAFLYIEMTSQPRKECGKELKVDWVAAGANVAGYVTGLGTAGKTKKLTGVLHLTVFVRGNLVNLETGESTQFSYSKPHKEVSKVGDRGCPSVLNGFNKAMESAGKNIALRLSPRVETREILVVSDTDHVNRNKSRVKAYLRQGIKWAKTNPPNYEAADEAWKNALINSGNKSAAAYWNLAVFRWYKGEMDGALDYFRKAQNIAGPEWLEKGPMIGSSKLDVISKFRAGKKRMDREGDGE